jgi:hypothetical protein
MAQISETKQTNDFSGMQLASSDGVGRNVQALVDTHHAEPAAAVAAGDGFADRNLSSQFANL